MSRPSKIARLKHKAYQQLARDYRDYLLILGYAKHTIGSRHKDLLRFLSWLESAEIFPFTQVTVHHLNHYRDYQSSSVNQNKGGSLSPSTIHHRLYAVQQCFSMLQEQSKLSIHPFSTFENTYRETRDERTTLTQDEIKQLYEVTENHQERAMLSLAYGCGLRAAELTALNVEDIKLRDEILIVPRGKGNNRRTIPLSPGVREDLRNYYHGHRPLLQSKTETVVRPSAFMLNRNGDRMKAYTWNKYLKRIIDRTENPTIQCKQISLHNLRHSIATHLLENGISVEQVRLFLGHRMVETTERYTRVNQEQLKKLSE